MSETTKIISDKHTIEFSLRLNNIHELFEAPAFDPFIPQPRVTSGIDDITDYLNTRRLRALPHIKTTLRLPADQITPDLETATRAALVRYCEFKLRQTRQFMAASRFEGFNKLPIGLLVAALTVVITAVMFLLLPNYLDNALVILTPIVTVIVWVSIWNPVETLLYEGWDDRRDIQIHTAILAMELHFQAE